MTHPSPHADSSINWGRAAGIFGHARPPVKVVERQFDYMDEELRTLSRTPYKDLDFSDLWYYYHDLSYVELQPELFAYLFPACLMDWHFSLQQNMPCSHGDAEFHNSIDLGDVLTKMLTQEQLRSVCEFFRDSLVYRMKNEKRFASVINNAPTFSWIARLNSLGLIVPDIDMIWTALWSVDTVGQAVCALQYCSSLMYFDGENPLFDTWGGVGPQLWDNDCMACYHGWSDRNADVIRQTFTVEFVEHLVRSAVGRLSSDPQFTQATQLTRQWNDCQDQVTERVGEFPRLLQSANPRGWTV